MVIALCLNVCDDDKPSLRLTQNGTIPMSEILFDILEKCS